MHQRYDDILDKISDPPQWFDENAVPRFRAFAPDDCADIYAREAVLALVTCQLCGHPFKVAFTHSRVGQALGDKRSLSDDIRERTLHFGDPPNIGCCAAGPTMNSEPRRVLEYWHRHDFRWSRVPEMEVDIQPEWVGPETTGGQDGR